MAAGQLADLAGFADVLREYRLFGGALTAVAVLIPAAELAAVGALLLGSRAGGVLGFVVAIFWAAVAAQAFARGLEVDNCGCFGVYLGQSLRWWVLLQDVYFILLAWAAARAVGIPLPAIRALARRAPARAGTAAPPPAGPQWPPTGTRAPSASGVRRTRESASRARTPG